MRFDTFLRRSFSMALSVGSRALIPPSGSTTSSSENSASFTIINEWGDLMNFLPAEVTFNKP